jgi:hypothetical protein
MLIYFLQILKIILTLVRLKRLNKKIEANLLKKEI